MPAQLINGSFPGPTIIADWGDTVVVHVTNSLQTNGTGLHFHGIRQLWTDQMDGVPSLTQCPVAPGDSFTYRWKATQYGTGWFHSHFYAWDGVFGGIIINGPATANYDVDLGHVFLNDWYHYTADELALQAATGGPPTATNGLINGTNTYTDSSTGTVTGSRFETTFKPGTRYRIRLVNAAADNHFRFAIDNHTMEVIANDFVPIVPYNTTDLSFGMGQRYDVIVTADQAETASAFWMRSIPQSACSESDATDSIKGIIRYEGASDTTSDPTTTEYSLTDSCDDESASNLVPYLAINASDATMTSSDTVGVQVTENALLWTINGTSFRTAWENPTLLQIAEANGAATSFTTKQQVIQLPDADQWVYLVVHSKFAQAHPMHLHGHDFWVLGSGSGEFDVSETAALQLVNAPRRDVAMMPASGYLVIGLKTNNPGVWLCHCHIAWHTSEGFAVQLVERQSEIEYDYDRLNQTCANWKAYAEADNLTQYDSGI